MLFKKFNMEKLKELGNNIVNIIFFFAAVIIIAAFIIFIYGVRPYITMSGSMEPDIKTGSICFVDTKAVYEDMEEGDVIAFESVSGSMVTHRVIGVTEEGIETKGDANDISDGVTTNEDNFRGKTIYSIPYIGYLVMIFQQAPVRVFIVTITIGYMLTAFLERRVERGMK